MPALATRGDLVQLKEHADRVLIGKLVRCWGTLAEFFGLEHTHGTHEVGAASGSRVKGTEAVATPRENLKQGHSALRLVASKGSLLVAATSDAA